MPHSLLDGGATQKLYKRRWFVLASVALLNATNAMIWNSFSTIAGLTHQYYDISFVDVNRLSEVFLILSVPIGFLSMWCIDHIGIRASLNVAAGCNAAGALMRLLSATSLVPPTSKYALLLTGQCIAGLAQPFAMSAPAKIAQHWFPERQRAVATTLGSMANAFGVLLSAVMSPLIVAKPEDIPVAHIVYTIPACLTLLAMLLSVNRSKPLMPPSASAYTQPESFCREILQLIRNKMYLLLAVCCGMGTAVVTTITALSAQILCPKGYDDVYAGVIIALMIGLGLVASLFTSVLADKTGFLQEIMKICLLMAVICLSLFVAVLGAPFDPIGLGIVISALGIFGFGQYPIALELAVETAYPVGEATSSGLLITLGNVGSAILIVVLQSIATPTPDQFGTCGADVLQGSTALDYTNGTITLAVMGVITCCVAVFFYKCPYRRRQAEEKARRQVVEQVQQQLQQQQNGTDQADDTPHLRSII